ILSAASPIGALRSACYGIHTPRRPRRTSPRALPRSQRDRASAPSHNASATIWTRLPSCTSAMRKSTTAPSAKTLAEGAAAIAKGQSVGAKSQRERDYLDALAVMYVGYEKVDHRTQREDPRGGRCRDRKGTERRRQVTTRARLSGRACRHVRRL